MEIQKRRCCEPYNSLNDKNLTAYFCQRVKVVNQLHKACIVSPEGLMLSTNSWRLKNDKLEAKCDKRLLSQRKREENVLHVTEGQQQLKAKLTEIENAARVYRIKEETGFLRKQPAACTVVFDPDVLICRKHRANRMP